MTGGSVDLGRRGVLLLGATAVLAACASTGRGADGDRARERGAGGDRVRTDLEPLERRFALLGRLSDAHWLGTALGGDSRLSVPGPTDVRLVGVARLEAGAVAALVGEPRWDFKPETPGPPPEPLAEFVPAGAGWVRSESFDGEVTSEGDSGVFYLDPKTDSVYFDAVDQ
ncbi:hypothetical protein GCM10010517_03990 [Streptosporangium fragile]|uniref:Uncharacterized protein n=1 Tax=Streptosporangium fragile TaxID=46186 RepID=A0ABN3VPJ0_9ACTN